MNLPETGFLRLAQILPQREVTEAEAQRNREAAAALRAEALAKGVKPKNDNRPCRARSATPGLIPGSPTWWWRGVREGRFPQPVKLGPRVTAWRVEDIRALIDSIA
ncbi:helix-turn-helix transcriptional regulator [Ferribacterium limneticum]|uniref:helix-turn-helix transcriptional regulator n=1 Tax=Ferribacterium limneticum TaxID=76259 RepID=UPI001CFC2D93|nr:AlpA family phage regulatory protein [Ferribacterium limneticum]UCV17220.1 AlpA family phage regulatory protein [Ferribacterium limneticum]